MNLQLITAQLKIFLVKLKHLRVLLFVVLVAIVYGFVISRVYLLSRAQPNQKAVTTQTVTLNYPHIDQATVNKIYQLQNNSVTVQALFNEARQNPFQE